MQNWDDLRFLLALARCGTMTEAAKRLGSNVATVSRRIERLGTRLGYPPFAKTAEGWVPASSILPLIDIAETVEARLALELNRARAMTLTERVPIRLGAPPVVTLGALLPMLRDAPHALGGIELTLIDRVSGDGLGDHDIIVRFDMPPAGRLMTRKVGRLDVRLYGRPDAEETGDWAGLTGWTEASGPMQLGLARFGRPPSLRVDTYNTLASLMRSSGLPGPLPDTALSFDDVLQPLDPGGASWSVDLWSAYHETRRNDPAIDRVLEWIVAACARAQDRAGPVAKTQARSRSKQG
ncbi:LysR family transcriptional regulator [Wenxinia marina]|uniref:Transcriptional regulator n=1 Tax=Wenxinia marina DSM 24838 TaxID=1123501 RepID=A0A0D0Q2I9_9RHOB|nr:LysR family transcriptional regulator [Wenxinia marina]KIQ68739.1 Transcriptional regulator [Wenxinia marina DSM 24838]GGL65544.1 hypothetical protein GCM10011392_20310 [Wenxinia marina]